MGPSRGSRVRCRRGRPRGPAHLSAAGGRRPRLPGGDLRLAVLAAYVLGVAVVGSLVTWLIVPLPGGAGRARTTRTGWSAMLGLFAAVPIAYLVLVLLHEIVKPLLARL